MRRWIAVLIGLIVLLPVAGSSGQLEIKEHVLYGGSNVDSTEQASPWIPIRGANRIAIRLWSAKAAFHASTDADSTFSDSIAVFRIAFTDSISNTNPIIAGDSVIVTSTILTNSDTTSKLVNVVFPPLQEALRGPGNGSGIYTYVVPVAPGGVATYGDGSFLPQYMRVYVTPLRRNTVTGGNSTEGKRVNGLKGLRGRALVMWNNR